MTNSRGHSLRTTELTRHCSIINIFLSDIYLTGQMLIPPASLIWLIRELIANPDGFCEFARYAGGPVAVLYDPNRLTATVFNTIAGQTNGFLL